MFYEPKEGVGASPQPVQGDCRSEAHRLDLDTQRRGYPQPGALLILQRGRRQSSTSDVLGLEQPQARRAEGRCGRRSVNRGVRR